jgi:hypothetical protein
VCDKERLIGFYSGRPYAYWAGDPGNTEYPPKYLLHELDRKRTPEVPHLVFGLVYSPKRGQVIESELGGWREVARFESHRAVGGDTMVLYAAPWDKLGKSETRNPKSE